MAPPPYRKVMEEVGLVKALQDFIKMEISLLKIKFPKSNIKLIDLDKSPAMKCRLFLDSHHLLGKCYNELTDHLLGGLF